MNRHRAIPLALSLVLLAVGPAAAQVTAFEIEALRAQQDAAQRRAIDLDNQLQARDTWRRADEAALAAQLQHGPVRAPELQYETSLPSTVSGNTTYPSIPDAALAESNRRVRDAAANRR